MRGCGVCLGSQRKTAPDFSLSDTVDLTHPLFLPRLEEKNQPGEIPGKLKLFLKLEFGGVSLRTGVKDFTHCSGGLLLEFDR